MATEVNCDVIIHSSSSFDYVKKDQNIEDKDMLSSVLAVAEKFQTNDQGDSNARLATKSPLLWEDICSFSSIKQSSLESQLIVRDLIDEILHKIITTDECRESSRGSKSIPPIPRCKALCDLHRSISPKSTKMGDGDFYENTSMDLEVITKIIEYGCEDDDVDDDVDKHNSTVVIKCVHAESTENINVAVEDLWKGESKRKSTNGAWSRLKKLFTRKQRSVRN